MAHLRTCIITRQKMDQESMIQINSFDDKLSLNSKWKALVKWRSVYIQNNEKAINSFIDRWTRFLRSQIKRNINEEEYKNLIQQLTNLSTCNKK